MKTLSTTEACERLKKHPDALDRLVRCGHVPSVTIDGEARIPVGVVEEIEKRGYALPYGCRDEFST